MKAYKDGKVVAEFMGAQPGPQVERFLDALVPSEAEELVRSGGEAELRRALELEPGRADAAVPLARILAGRGEREEALELLERRPRLVRRRRPGGPPAARVRPGAPGRVRRRSTTATSRSGLDRLIGAIPATETPSAATTCAARSSACSTSSGSSTPSRASRAASSPPRLY